MIFVDPKHNSNTLNMFVKPTEKFLQAFEKSFSSKNEVLPEYSVLVWSFIFRAKTFFKGL